MNEHARIQEALARQASGERSTRIVVIITALMMAGEIAAGLLYGSMALLADGWHMSTHVAAFGITLFAYWYARRHAQDRFFAFGTGKVSVLGGFASAVALIMVALFMAIESIARAFAPAAIQFNEALIVAGIGLAVNLGCARILHASGGHGHTHHDHDHHHEHDHEHEHDHNHPHGRAGNGGWRHQDHNLKAAYFHVLADALTSVFAIVALVVGKLYGLLWVDALMGVVGAVVITKWAWGLLAETSAILLDGGDHRERESELRRGLASVGVTAVERIRIWSTATDLYAVSAQIKGPAEAISKVEAHLGQLPWVTHSSVELVRPLGAGATVD